MKIKKIMQNIKHTSKIIYLRKLLILFSHQVKEISAKQDSQ